jgi:hypothetical protein
MGYLAVDMSSWSGELTEKEARDLKAYGVGKILVNTWGPWTRQQLEMGQRVGLLLEAYCYLYFDFDIEARVRAALEAIRGFPVECLWLDAEDDTMTVGAGEIVRKLHQAVEVVEGWNG